MTTIFRNDDINPNSDIDQILGMYAVIRKYFPDARIISAVNLLAQTSQDGSAYAAIKPRDIDFYALDRMMDQESIDRLREVSEIASHGMAHLDHRALHRDAQEFSIAGSCSLLRTKIFVPPFWRWNQHTIDICEAHGIEIPISQDWINLDDHPARADHAFFCLHSWKFPSVEAFEDCFRDMHKFSTA